jgi:hypothetical protein
MCLIVDANVATQVFTLTPSKAFAPVWTALWRKRAVAVHGGKLTQEYIRIVGIRRILKSLDQLGALRKVADRPVREQTIRYQSMSIQSDDSHILGLASAAGIRLLCSHDKNLHTDFTNPKLLQPSGAVYQSASHRHLIVKHCHKKKVNRRGKRKKR